MNTVHTLREYIETLRSAGILVESTVGGELAAREVRCLTYDTRALSGDALFICKGAHFKEDYLRDALSRGAVAYVAEKKHNVDAPCILVSDIRYSLVVLGQLFYNHVTDKLTSVGITGTKGKSTTAYYVRYILDDWLRAQGKPACAILSSIDNYDGKGTEESHITTPEVLELYQHFENAYESGISHLVMEASSQALKYGRVRGITFDVAAFLNIGSDHISPIEHPDFEDYFSSKLKIFDSCRFGCVNTDAKYADRVVEYAKERCELITFGSHESDTVSCRGVEKRGDGLYFTVASPKYNGEFSITMPGLFNVSNALAAMAVCMALDVPVEHVRAGLRRARAAGRMQIYESRDGQVTVIVDYAHNRMSFDALYRSTKIEYPGRQMISVFGCPGSHALQRRKDLGELSGQNCDFVFITEEDSGEEPFTQIAADIEKHVACPHLVLEDRAECIRRAILDGRDARVVLLTGKGEETTMKRGSVFVPYPSDVELTLKYLAEYDKAHLVKPTPAERLSGVKRRKDFLPIILGSDENAYGTARLFQEAYGVAPLLLCTQQLVPTRHSHLFLCRIIPDFEREDVFPDALLEVLKQCAQDYEKLLVIPCSDYYTGLLCRHYDRFEGLIANRFISEELLETFDTKDSFYALCEQYGMDYPKTVVAAPGERESIAEHLPFDFPIVVKPENSNALDYLRCHFEGQKKVFFFDTKAQYLEMVRNMNRSDYRGKLILQEFIPGGDDAMRVLNSYSDLDGHVRAMCLGQPVLEYYDPKSVGNYAAIISRGDQALYGRMKEFLERLGYVGFSNIDMKYDRRTGRYVLFEINPRLGRSSYFCRAAGLNMMKLMTDDIVYGRRGDCVYNHTAALWQNVPDGILRRYVKNPELSAELRRLKGTHTLFCRGDLPPARLYRLLRYYAAQYHNFRDYYFDKEKP